MTAKLECYFNPYPAYYIYSLYGLGCISTPISIFGMYCILKKTPSHLKDYRKTLLVYEVSVSCLDFFISFICTPVIFLPFPLGYEAGLVSLFGVESMILLAVLLIILIQAFCGVLQLFHYRLMVILPPNSRFRWKKGTVIAMRFVISFISIAPICALLLFYPETDREANIAALKEKYTCVETLLNFPPMRITDSKLSRIMYLYVGVVGLSLWVIGLSLALKTHFLMKNMHAISEKTLQLQHKFQKALIIQTLIPVIIIIIPGWAMIIVFLTDDIAPQYCTNLFMASLAVHGLSGNIAMILFNTEYLRFARLTLHRIFGFVSKPRDQSTMSSIAPPKEAFATNCKFKQS